MSRTKRLAAFLIVAVIASVALEAFAQFGGGNRGRMGGGRPQAGAQRSETPGGGNDIAGLLDFRLESMQEDLKLSPSQQRLWDAYAEKVRALGADIVRERERARTPSLTPPTAPQLIDHALDVARNRMTALEDIAVSAKTLYESLTSEQKLLADSRVATLVPLLVGTAAAAGGPDPMRQKPPAGGRDRDAGGPR